jgi:hypothetical protein
LQYNLFHVGGQIADRLGETKQARRQAVPLELTVCAKCTPKRPELCAAIQDLCQIYGSRLQLTELSCMSACDEAAAVFIDMDFYPEMTAARLRTKIKYLLGDSAYNDVTSADLQYAR